MRDDFSLTTKESLARRVGHKCSNPNCRQPTSGPSSDIQKATNIGVAAHIKAAAPGGKRYDAKQSTDERKDIANGIWLCQNCAKLVDSDETRYTVELIQKWKAMFEEAASLALEQPNGGSTTTNIDAEVVSINQSGGQTAKTIYNERPLRRTLVHARDAIIAELRKHAPIAFEIHTLMNDSEANELAREIKEIFDSAGWSDNKIILGMGGTYPPGFTVSREKPTKASEIMTMVLYNSGLKGAIWAELRGDKHGIYIGPNPDTFTGDTGNRITFRPKDF